MNKYNEILSSEYPTENSDTYGYEKYMNGDMGQQGGNNNSSVSVPNGGFPPIYICNSREQKKEITSVRAYSTNNTAVSIRDIMKNRRKKI
jgi:hypothetical protein